MPNFIARYEIIQSQINLKNQNLHFCASPPPFRQGIFMNENGRNMRATCSILYSNKYNKIVASDGNL